MPRGLCMPGSGIGRPRAIDQPNEVETVVPILSGCRGGSHSGMAKVAGSGHIKMPYLNHSLRTNDLAQRLSALPLLLADLVDELYEDGLVAPAKFIEYFRLQGLLQEQDRAKHQHQEYLRELFGVFGDSSALVSEAAIWLGRIGTEAYVSELLTLKRQVLARFPRGTRLVDLPRWQWALDPYMASHWRAVQSTELGVADRYFAFQSEALLPEASSALKVLEEFGLNDLQKSIPTVKGIKEGPRLFCAQFNGAFLDLRRSTRTCLVLTFKLPAELDLVLVFDEIRISQSQRPSFRAFHRLISSDAQGVSGSAVEGVVMEFSMAEVLPGSFVYEPRSPGELPLCLAFHLRIFEALAPALRTVLQGDVPIDS
jgi:hypothetical protein